MLLTHFPRTFRRIFRRTFPSPNRKQTVDTSLRAMHPRQNLSFSGHLATYPPAQNWLGHDVHEDHHDKPYYHVCVDPPDLVAGWTLAAACVFTLVLPLPLALTVLAAYMSMGLVYEWVHFFVHTRWVGRRLGGRDSYNIGTVVFLRRVRVVVSWSSFEASICGDPPNPCHPEMHLRLAGKRTRRQRRQRRREPCYLCLGPELLCLRLCCPLWVAIASQDRSQPTSFFPSFGTLRCCSRSRYLVSVFPSFSLVFFLNRDEKCSQKNSNNHCCP